jgi:hypothetical protein
MIKALKILRYTFVDMLRSKWILIYIGFFLSSDRFCAALFQL